MQIQIITTKEDLAVVLSEAIKEVAGVSRSLEYRIPQPPLNRKEAAKYLGVSLPTLGNLERSGQLKGFFVGRQKRYTWEAIAAVAGKSERRQA